MINGILTFTQNFATIGAGQHVATLEQHAVDRIFHTNLANVLVNRIVVFIFICAKRRGEKDELIFATSMERTFEFVADLFILPQEHRFLDQLLPFDTAFEVHKVARQQQL